MVILNSLGFGKTKEDGSKKALYELADILLTFDSREKMVDFLEGILTPKELLEIPTRLQIIRLLKKGVSQHEVAGKLGVGVATVTRGAKEIQKGRFKNV